MPGGHRNPLTDADSDSGSSANIDADLDTDTYAYTYVDTYFNSLFPPVTDRNRNVYTHENCDTNPYFNIYRHTIADAPARKSHTHGNTDALSNPSGDIDVHRDVHGHTDADRVSNLDGHSFA